MGVAGGERVADMKPGENADITACKEYTPPQSTRVGGAFCLEKQLTLIRCSPSVTLQVLITED